MINKQNLWFLTLFSLIMVLSIYYLTMSNDTLSTLNVNSDISKGTDVVISEENDTLVALKVQDEEELLQRMEELQNILLSDVATLQEKNDAYEELQTLNKTESEKEVIVKLIKDQYKLDSVVKIEDSTITITIASTKHDATLANNIIRSVQELYDSDKYITVKFG
ncbi:stage III sporulation protein AH [Mycoplasma sp. CAG:776]|nr:stage III sporulation protein AH [Mycoplasma sp. CAG:776]